MLPKIYLKKRVKFVLECESVVLDTQIALFYLTFARGFIIYLINNKCVYNVQNINLHSS